METFFLPEDNKAKKVHIETYGCQMNVADSEVIAAMLQTVGGRGPDSEHVQHPRQRRAEDSFAAGPLQCVATQVGPQYNNRSGRLHGRAREG